MPSEFPPGGIEKARRDETCLSLCARINYTGRLDLGSRMQTKLRTHATHVYARASSRGASNRSENTFSGRRNFRFHRRNDPSRPDARNYALPNFVIPNMSRAHLSSNFSRQCVSCPRTSRPISRLFSYREPGFSDALLALPARLM